MLIRIFAFISRIGRGNRIHLFSFFKKLLALSALSDKLINNLRVFHILLRWLIWPVVKAKEMCKIAKKAHVVCLSSVVSKRHRQKKPVYTSDTLAGGNYEYSRFSMAPELH